MCESCLVCVYIGHWEFWLGPFMYFLCFGLCIFAWSLKRTSLFGSLWPGFSQHLTWTQHCYRRWWTLDWSKCVTQKPSSVKVSPMTGYTCHVWYRQHLCPKWSWIRWYSRVWWWRNCMMREIGGIRGAWCQIHHRCVRSWRPWGRRTVHCARPWRDRQMSSRMFWPNSW